jgi:hypothetical protein
MAIVPVAGIATEPEEGIAANWSPEPTDIGAIDQ